MSNGRAPNRWLLVAAGLCGALGVGLAAAASHAADGNLGIAASFLQLHAPALIGLSLLGRNRLAGVAGTVLLLGLMLFAGDLVSRSLLSRSLFPFAAPLGGGALIAGWLLIAAAGLIRTSAEGADTGAAPGTADEQGRA